MVLVAFGSTNTISRSFLRGFVMTLYSTPTRGVAEPCLGAIDKSSQSTLQQERETCPIMACLKVSAQVFLMKGSHNE